MQSPSVISRLNEVRKFKKIDIKVIEFAYRDSIQQFEVIK